jgi:hypothetical protein
MGTEPFLNSADADRMSLEGHSRPGRADSSSGLARSGPIATDFCDAIKNRDVPEGDVTH